MLAIVQVPWMDDQGTVRVNRGMRVEFNSALGKEGRPHAWWLGVCLWQDPTRAASDFTHL